MARSVLSQGSNYAHERVTIVTMMLKLHGHLLSSASEHFSASVLLFDVATYAAAEDFLFFIFFYPTRLIYHLGPREQNSDMRQKTTHAWCSIRKRERG